MKVLIYYNPGKSADAFEGARLRKTLKGACEVSDITWVNSPYQEVDIAHFISPFDIGVLREKKEIKIPCVVSAFYAEDDPRASFISQRDETELTKAGLTMLQEADLILVPSRTLKDFAISRGIDAEIEVLEPAVRLNRFKMVGLESTIFRRYFGIKEKEPCVVATGSYKDQETYKLIKNVAKSAPNIQFYYFAAGKNGSDLGYFNFVRKFDCPRNLHLQSIVQDDIYRSAMINAIAYISNDYRRPDSIGPMEAFAAKTQVVAFSGSRSNPLLKEGESCFFFVTPQAMGEYLIKLNSGEAQSTITSAYDIARAHNLINHGNKLKSIYEQLLENTL